MPVLTFGSSAAASLVLSDGTREMELIGDGEGTYVVVDGFELPAPAPDNTYVETPDSEGRRRLRTRYPNVESGVIRLRIDHSEDLAGPFWEAVDSLLELVMSAHRQKGTLTYTPTDGAEITYDLESCHISDLPQQGHAIALRRYEPVITFECLPFGRLEPVTLFTDETFTGPVGSVVIDNIPGHADALMTSLTLEDDSSQQAGWVEVAVERDGYREDADLLYNDTDLTAAGSTTSTTRAGAYSSSSVKRQNLGTSATDFVTIADLTHVGRKRISGRFYAEENSWVRAGYRHGTGAYSWGPWRPVEADAFREIHLMSVDIREPPVGVHGITIKLQAYGEVAGNFDIDYLEIIGAERRCAAHQPGLTLMGSGDLIRFRSDSVIQAQAFCPIEGDYVTLPPSTRAAYPLRLTVRRRRNDTILLQADDGVTDEFLGTLIVTPRVALVGE
jgi:hypothetical protein